MQKAFLEDEALESIGYRLEVLTTVVQVSSGSSDAHDYKHLVQYAHHFLYCLISTPQLHQITPFAPEGLLSFLEGVSGILDLGLCRVEMAEQRGVVGKSCIESLIVLCMPMQCQQVSVVEYLGCYALSTEPFIALESISFVLRKESMSFPSEEPSRSCNARSTGLNCANQSPTIEVPTN